MSCSNCLSLFFSLLVSHKFGFGLMDCAAMVDLAKSWRSAPRQLIYHTHVQQPTAWVGIFFSKVGYQTEGKLSIFTRFFFLHFADEIIWIGRCHINKQKHLFNIEWCLQIWKKPWSYCSWSVLYYFNLLSSISTLDRSTPYNVSVYIPECRTGDMGCIRYVEHVQLNLTVSSTKRGAISVSSFS